MERGNSISARARATSADSPAWRAYSSAITPASPENSITIWDARSNFASAPARRTTSTAS